MVYLDLTYSFMEEYDPAWSPNEGDSALRYAFQNQPDIAAWNCERLGEAFSSIVGESKISYSIQCWVMPSPTLGMNATL